MQNSEILLYHLEKNARRQDYKFSRLYRLLYNPELYDYVLKILGEKNPEYKDRSIDSDLLFKLIVYLKDESYQPLKIKPNGKILESEVDKLKDLPRFFHRLLIEVVVFILEIIFNLNDCSNHVYGFNDSQSPHQALIDILHNYDSCETLISVDLTDNFNFLSRDHLERTLRERIDDERFIRLINKYIKAGYFSDFKFNRTYSGTVRAGVLSNTLSRIYLLKLDSTLSRENFCYTRYASAFLIGYNGKLKLNLNKILEETGFTAVTNFKATPANLSTRFLGYQVRVLERGKKKLPPSIGKTYVELRIPHGRIEKFILEKKMVVDIDAKKWKPIHRGSLLNLSDTDIISIYSSELKSFYDYYALAENVSRKLGQLHYVMEYSCLKTFANKYRTTLLKFKRAHTVGQDWGIVVESKNGKYLKTIYKGFKRRFKAPRDSRIDLIEYNNKIWKAYRKKHNH